MTSRVETAEFRGRSGYVGSLVAAVLGLGLSIELTRLHLAHASDPSQESYCNVNSAINCDAVTTSDYSTLFGIPLSVWGIFAYSAALWLAFFGLRSRSKAPALGLLAIGVASTIGALLLAYISAFRIGAFCLLCMVSWGADLALLVSASIAVRSMGWNAVQRDAREYIRSSLGTVAIVGIASIIALGFAARVTAPRDAIKSGSLARASATVTPEVGAEAHGPATGQDEAGHYYIGAKEPKLTIAEFSDYQCPFCAKAHTTLRALVNKYPEDIRVVHRHFPLDNDCNPTIKRPFHRHSCYYARLSVCAGAFDKFWQANDFLFEHGREEAPVALETIARAVGVDAAKLRACVSERADGWLKSDLDAGVKLNIDGTPTLLIDGNTYTGPLPAFVLEKYPL